MMAENTNFSHDGEKPRDFPKLVQAMLGKLAVLQCSPFENFPFVLKISHPFTTQSCPSPIQFLTRNLHVRLLYTLTRT